ncbi:sphingomyelin phosphodiesterase 4 [Choristoneura fumiferana]|uniref:sphingomyelin phosphodiesterase 4 n=1 Tax=Choristoneura fumiferana TaxID=7141 RepID=UPI003D15EFDF
MAHDIMSQFYTCLNYPLHEKLRALTNIIDQSSPNKDLQALFPQLINNIFASSFSNGWGLRTVTGDLNRYEYELLISFLEPQGPMFRLCYKLLSDPQLKYNLPLNALPMDLQMTLERGRTSQFYSDMLTTDSQSLNVVALALNPFDFYIFNFAIHLVSYSQNKSSWENWNSAYFALACDYLMHFLPSDPNVPVLPHIPNYTGKVHMAAPLQTANRPFSQHTPSLLIIPDLPGISNQHTPTQNQSRNEVWRSETVLQVFIDIWMSVEQFNARSVEMYQRNYAIANSSPERVRTVRVLVKHIHSFSAKHLSDPESRSSTLRKYARQIMCARAYHYIKHLVTTWPLDASFRLVMELWLSLIQPWRYTNNTINQDRFPYTNNNQEEGSGTSLDASFMQFIAENYPAYTCIFQLVLPRFTMLDLTSFKNAVMLFRLGKVFSQQHLVPILKDLEKAIILNNSSFYSSPDTSFNSSALDQSYTYNGIALHKWVAIAKQALSELNLSTNFEYEPIWGENNKQKSEEFVKKIISAKLGSEKNIEQLSKKIHQQHQGFWAGIKHWLMLGGSIEDEQALEESKKVPTYLNASIHFFADIFGLQEASLQPLEPVAEDISEHSSFANSIQFPLSITNKLRDKSRSIRYLGDPDLMPITTYESTILVRMLYQIATRVNELYQDEFPNLWNRNDFWGYVAREVLQTPCTIQTYMRDASNRQSIVSQNLPPRLSLRRLGSHAFVGWLIIGYVILRMFFSVGGLFYIFILFVIWALFVFTKASCKMLRIMS